MTVEADPGAGREVRALSDGDSSATAALHARALPDSFFVRLGLRFLRDYHRSFVDSPHAVALVITKADEVEGFLLAVVAPGPHGAYVLRQWGARLALRASLGLLARPQLLTLFLRTRMVRYTRGLWRRIRQTGGTEPASDVAGTWAVLSHVAVDSGRRGSGAGAALVQALHDRVTSVGGAGVVLLTAVEGPGAAFYGRLGYECEGEVAGADGKAWLRYRWRAV